MTMKICNADNCNNPVFGGGYCKYHQYMRTDKKIKPVKTLLVSNTIHDTTKVKSKLKKANTGEFQMFKEIWNERPHVSELSGTKLPVFDTHSFHHLLTKQAYPEYRLVKENIVLLTRAEHRAVHDYSWQQLIEKDSRWETIYNRYLAMKQYGKEETSNI